MKRNLLPNCLIFSVLLLNSAAVFAQEPAAQFVLRLVESSDKNTDPTSSRLLQTALEALHKTNRVDILPATSTTGAATHLLEASANFGVSNNAFDISGFNDSLKTMSFSYQYKVDGRVNLLVTEVESGRVVGSTICNSSGSNSATYKLGYDKVGWAKGMKRDDPKLRAAVLDRARPQLSSNFPGLFKGAINNMVGAMAGSAGKAGDRLFRYRLDVLEATEIDKDEAEKVQISGGKNFDLKKGDRLVCYILRELKSGEKSFEHFEVLGKLKFESDNDKGAICDVSKGKEEILAALQAKKKVYCTIGDAPYTVQTKSEQAPQLAIGSFIVPKGATDQNRENLYRRLRVDLLSVKNVQLLERQKLAALEAEKNIQKQEEFMDKAAIDQYKSVGADLLMEVKFQDPKVSVEREFATNVATTASVNFTFTFRLIRVETGEVLEEKTGRFTQNYAGDMGGGKHPLVVEYNQKPNQPTTFFLNHALNLVNFGADDFMKQALPPRIIVAEITDTKKDRADEVLVVGDFNMENRDKYHVMRKRIVEVDGQQLPRFEQIGLISLRDDEGEGVANAKVKDGGKEIMAAMKAGDLLFCVDKPNWLERLSSWGNNQAEKYGY